MATKPAQSSPLKLSLIPTPPAPPPYPPNFFRFFLTIERLASQPILLSASIIHPASGLTCSIVNTHSLILETYPVGNHALLRIVSVSRSTIGSIHIHANLD
jgi:hypothetical protein